MNGRSEGHWPDPIDSANCQLSHKSNYQTGQNDHWQFSNRSNQMNYPSTHHMHSGCKCEYCKSLKETTGGAYVPSYHHPAGYASSHQQQAQQQQPPHYPPAYQHSYDQYPPQHYQMGSAHNSSGISHSNSHLYPYQTPYSSYSMGKSSDHSSYYFVESTTANNSGNEGTLSSGCKVNDGKLPVPRRVTPYNSTNSNDRNENVYSGYINAKGYYSDSDSDAANQMSKKMQQQDGRFKFHRKRPRTIFTPYQLIYLEAEFKKNPYITGSRKQELSKKSDLSGYQISVWFQNRRAKFKKEERTKDY